MRLQKILQSSLKSPSDQKLNPTKLLNFDRKQNFPLQRLKGLFKWIKNLPIATHEEIFCEANELYMYGRGNVGTFSTNALSESIKLIKFW